MSTVNARSGGYWLAAFLGAAVGGGIVLLATKAIPRIVTQIMAGMMQNMMAQMRANGCNPSEI